MSEHDKPEKQSLSHKTHHSDEILPVDFQNPLSIFNSGASSSSLRRSLQQPNPNSQQIMALQHTIGNQAVYRMLNQQETLPIQKRSESNDELQRAPTIVRNQISDGRYGWTSRYEVDFLDLDDFGGVCLLDLKVRLRRAHGVTQDDQDRVQTEAGDAFRSFFNNRFGLVDFGTTRRYYLVINVVFVTSGQHATVLLRRGSGRDDSSNWFVDSPAIDRAHELGHLLGLRDEYVDTTVPNRRNASAPGVHSDHSLMGDYPNEGADLATVHQRHADRIAGHIGRATGRTLIATTREAAEQLYASGIDPAPSGASSGSGGSTSSGSGSTP